MMNREQAIEALVSCGRHWHTGKTCDSCWADQHRCPPTLVRMAPKAIKALERAIQIGQDSEACIRTLRELGLETTR